MLKKDLLVFLSTLKWGMYDKRSVFPHFIGTENLSLDTGKHFTFSDTYSSLHDLLGLSGLLLIIDALVAGHQNCMVIAQE